MITWRRVVALVVLLVVLAVAWTAWLAYRTQQDLSAAQDAVDRLQAAIEADDDAGRDAAAADLREAASGAAGRTDGLWWGLTTHVPFVGDDARGVEALSASLDDVATGAVDPLLAISDRIDTVVTDGRIDTTVVSGLQEPVRSADTAVTAAAAAVSDLDSSGYVTPLRTRFDTYVDRVESLQRAMSAARTTTDVLPSMLGTDGARRYLLVFQNNAEVRATGGVPGSWAEVRADDGELSIVQQGSAADFPVAQQGAAPLTDEELALYGEPFAQYWQDPGFTPDFPRAAELFQAHWDDKFPDAPLDGVLALDPVAISYLLEGTGPVQAGDVTLSAADVVDTVLNRAYLELPVEQQDAFFAGVAKAVFEASTRQVAAPLDLVEGFARAARERRFLVASFDEGEREALAGTPVLGRLSGDDGATPHVDLGLNDTTGSKMSYYLRYATEVRATSCADDVQSLEAEMRLHQTITMEEGAALPDYVNGGGFFGTDPGAQLVAVRVYGPYGGTISDVRIDGEPADPDYGLSIDGRPVVLLGPEVRSTDDVVVTWKMTTGPGQTGDGVVASTPGVVPGAADGTFTGAC